LVSADRIFDTVKKLSAFPDRHHRTQSGIEAANWLKSRFEGMSRRRNDVTVTLVPHRGFAQPSVVARIAGSGPRATQKIVLGAHLDSINMRGQGQPAPGADDDASGIATLLEIFQILTQTGFRPDRTIEFIGYAGEEGGLLGSQQIAAKHKQDRVPVYAVVQFDMTMFPGRLREMTLITDNVDAELTRFTAMLIDTYVKARWGEDRCGYGCSDHASWTRYGYPSVMPFESSMEDDNKTIHSARDTTQWLDSAYGQQFAKLGLSWAVELATGD
ncbi:MAG TPA: M20/M25/M40 family metallo-hydrolase, partial [Bdellovibrionota bacterium]|nr:M20/M25/M40 family metallo-hydrolase [Bdellovibrionota bacterium]